MNGTRFSTFSIASCAADHARALDDSQKCISLNSTFIKAYWRAFTAATMLSEWQLALSLVQQVLSRCVVVYIDLTLARLCVLSLMTRRLLKNLNMHHCYCVCRSALLPSLLGAASWCLRHGLRSWCSRMSA